MRKEPERLGILTKDWNSWAPLVFYNKVIPAYMFRM